MMIIGKVKVSNEAFDWARKVIEYNTKVIKDDGTVVQIRGAKIQELQELAVLYDQGRIKEA